MTALDSTAESRRAAAPADPERLVSRLHDSNVLGVLIADDNTIVDANDAVLDMIGYTRDDLRNGRINWRSITPPEWTDADDRALLELHTTGVCAPFEKEYVHRDGHRVPIILGATGVGTDPPLWVSYIVDLSAQRRAEAERAALMKRTNDALSLAAVAEQQVTMLVSAGRLLTAALDEAALVDNAAALTVPGFADFCAILLPVHPAGERAGVSPKPDADRLPAFRVAAATHTDPSRAGALARLRGTVIAHDPSLAVHRAGAPSLVADIAEMAGNVPDAAIAAALHGLGLTSMLVVPLATRSERVGVMVLARQDTAKPLDAADIEIAGDLANQLAVAISNAHVSQRQTTIAATLQHALLPGELPAPPGLELAARYLPATEGANVGGDWYDVIPLGGGAVGLVVGDAVGHDLHAATLMGQLRNSVRTLAVLLRDPAQVLALANDAIIKLSPGGYATVFYAVVESDGMLTYATAGHPPALVLTSGQADFLDVAPGPLLGAVANAAYPEARRAMPDGAALVLYTDGIVEHRRGPVDEGMDELAKTAVRVTHLPADALCGAIVRDVLADRPRFDDVCLLVARRSAGHSR